MSERATCWSVTINMKNVSQSTADECIQNARAAGWKIDGQLEQGDEGTKHYQLMVSTPQTRFTAVKKMFPTANIQIARKPQALKAYVSKEDTRIGELPKQNEFYPTLAKFWDLLIPELQPLSQYGSELANPKRRLDQLDDAVRKLIAKGYHVEGIAMNPSTRSSWNAYNVSIMERSKNEKNRREEIDRQTDRQDESLSEDSTITEDGTEGDDEEGSGDSSQSGEEDQEDGACYGSDDEDGEGEDGESGFSSDDGNQTCSEQEY